MKRPVVRLFVVLGIIVGSEAPAAEEAKLPTNIEMLGGVTRSAVQEALEAAPLQAYRTVTLIGAEQNRGNWFIEEYLVEALQARGLSVRAGGVAPPETAPADSVPADTAAGVQSAVPSSESEGLADSAGTPVGSAQPASTLAPILEYRILDLALRYGGGGRRLFIGSRTVNREATAAVRARLLDGRTREILWVGSGDARADDRVKGGRLKQLEATVYPCEPPQLSSGGYGKLVEPAVVTAIVAGLVYLFYTNQN